MKKLLVPLIVLLIFASCKPSIHVNKFELQQVFKDVMDENLFNNTFVIDSIDGLSQKSIIISDTVYSIAELDGLHQVWINGIFDSATVVSNNFLDSFIHKPNIVTPYNEYRFSLPYFTNDKKIFVIWYYHYCGNLCSESSLRQYKKIGGHWVFMRSFYSIMS